MRVNPHTAEIFLYKPEGFLNLKSSYNILASSFRFIWIPVLWVNDHATYF